MIRLTIVIPAQQHAPRSIGFPPFLIRLTMLLFMPIAAIANMMRNLLRVLSGANTLEATPKCTQIVVITDASTK